MPQTGNPPTDGPRFVDGWHVVPYQVIWRDLDAMGHVNNSVFFTYFEWGRTRYWLELNGGGAPSDIGFIVARASCDFKAELGLADRIEIRTRIGEMRNTSLDFLSEIRTSNGEVIAARGTVVAVLYSWADKAKLPITRELRERVDAFQGERR
jgi:acyl-CoA thioester hydrolase